MLCIYSNQDYHDRFTLQKFESNVDIINIELDNW